jgi:heme exporter protein A
MLQARNLEITRGDRRLFGGIALELRPGTLLRVTGSNGSGKTSLLRALCGLVMPSAGEILWQNGNIRTLGEEYWKHLIHIGHQNALKDELSARENLAALCALSGIRAGIHEQGEALARFGLAGREHLPAKVLSQGQRRRTTLARLALSAALPLWILDEPFAALDAAAVSHLQSIITTHLASGGMVVLTTHQEAPISAPAVLGLDLDRERH